MRPLSWLDQRLNRAPWPRSRARSYQILIATGLIARAGASGTDFGSSGLQGRHSRSELEVRPANVETVPIHPPCAISLWVCLIFCGMSLCLAPEFHASARATATPGLDPHRDEAALQLDKDANHFQPARPTGVSVSIPSVMLRSATPSVYRGIEHRNQIAQAPDQPIKFPNGERVALQCHEAMMPEQGVPWSRQTVHHPRSSYCSGLLGTACRR